MDKLIVRVLSLKSDKKAVTALEYGIIASILGVAFITIFSNLSGILTTVFSKVGASL